MSEKDDKLIRFADPKRNKNIWNGSLRANVIHGWEAQVLCIPDDTSTNLKSALDFSEFDHLLVEADVDQRAILLDLERVSHQLSMSNNRFVSKVSFRSKAVVFSSDHKLELETEFPKFTVEGPAIFSLIDFKPYKVKASKR